MCCSRVLHPILANSREIAENFRTQILNAKERDASALQTPVRTLGSVTFLYLRHADIYILALTRSNANAMLSLKFMTSVSSCFSMGGMHAVFVQD